jgi:hypothetical protein
MKRGPEITDYRLQITDCRLSNPTRSTLLAVCGLLLAASTAVAASASWNSFELVRQSARQLSVRVTMDQFPADDSAVACCRLVAVPPGTMPTVSVVSADSMVQGSDRLDLSDESDGSEGVAFLGAPVQFRDLRLVPVIVRRTRTLRSGESDPSDASEIVYSRVDLNIEIPPGLVCTRAVPPAFAQLYGSTVLNYGGLDNAPAPECYLMIVPDAYYDNALALAQWKERKGFQTVVKKKSEVGSNQNQIRDYIATAYHTWPVPPTYVLLLGTIDQIPAFTIPTVGVVTDFSYGCIDGDDFFPEVLVGRLPANSGPMLDYLTEKIFNYERTPYMSDTLWYRRATMVATVYQEGGTPTTTALETKRWIRNLMLNRGFSEVDTVFDPPYHGSGVAPIDTSVSHGVCFVNGRGWGNSGGWNFPPYRTSDVQGLSNGWRQPVVTSLYCGTGAFNANPCFGEAWLQAGSPAQPKGAVAFFGPSWLSTSTRWNNCLDYGIYAGILNEGITTLGPAMLRAKLEIFDNFPMPCDSFYLRAYFYVYNILGDPGLQLWTGSVPQALAVGLQSSVEIGASRFAVTVSDQVSGALVSLVQGGTTRVTGYTNAGGDAVLAVPPLTGETLFVTVTKPGYAPWEGWTVPQAADAHLDVDGCSPDTVNPGSAVNLTLNLKNYGTSQTATGVQAVLRSSDPWVTVTDSVKSYGDIAPGVSVPGGPFAFQVSSQCTSAHCLGFELAVSSSVGSSSSAVLLRASPGRVSYVGHAGDPAPGQAVDVVVTIRNNGSRSLSNVVGTLVSTSQCMVVEDAGGAFGNIAQGESAANSGDAFHVRAKPELAAGRSVGFDLVLTGDDGFSQTVHLALTAGAVTQSVPMGPDAHGYYAYDDVDASYPAHPSYSWAEIDPNQGGSGTLLSLGNDETRVVALPFVFRYYGVDYSRISVCDNGFLCCDSTDLHSFYNWRIPSAYGPPNIIAPLWDDFRADTAGASGVYYYNDEANHRFVVEWSNVRHVHGFKPPVLAELQTFEVILYDPAFDPTPTGDGEIVYQYDTVFNDDTLSSNCHDAATVGIANQGQNVGLQVTFADSLSPASAPLAAGRAIKFTTIPPDTFTGVRAEESRDRVHGLLLEAFPTPNCGTFVVRYGLEGPGIAALRLFDCAGRQAACWRVSGSGRVSVGSERALPSGVYLLTLTLNPGGRIIPLTRKLVVSGREH